MGLVRPLLAAKVALAVAARPRRIAEDGNFSEAHEDTLDPDLQRERACRDERRKRASIVLTLATSLEKDWETACVAARQHQTEDDLSSSEDRTEWDDEEYDDDEEY